MSDLDQRIAEAVHNPQNVGEMADADSVGTAGSPGCGDMMRVWLKFKTEPDGRRVIDRATFQAFGCETAIAVASVATQMLVGKTREEARGYSGTDLAAPLGPLPPMKIHCAHLVEEALRFALEPSSGHAVKAEPGATCAASGDSNEPDSLLGAVARSAQGALGGKIEFLDEPEAKGA